MTKKIRWTENALQELERLLGTRNLPDIEAIDDAIGGLDFPWPITVKSITATVDPTGEIWSNLVIEFDEIPGAGSYEVRMSLIPETGQYELEVLDLYTFSASTDGYISGGQTFYDMEFSTATSIKINGPNGSNNGVTHTSETGTTLESNDMAIVLGCGDINGWFGGFDTWTAYASPASNQYRRHYYSTVFVGQGGNNTPITSTTWALGSPFHYPKACMAVIKNVGSRSVHSFYTDGYETISTPFTSYDFTTATQPGDIVVFGSWTATASWEVNNIINISGLTNHRGVSHQQLPLYGKSATLLIGVATGNSASAEFTYYTDGDPAGGELFTMIIR